MSDKLITLLHDARKNGGVSIGQLCAGICSESMYEKIERGQKSIDRESLKRLLARLGIDSGEYEHYLEYPDYDKWCHRMKIINHIEDGMYVEADELLDKYIVEAPTRYNKTRVNIEKQFVIFMRLQIMRNLEPQRYEKEARAMYERALKLTVPHIDKTPLKDIMLSPIEYNLVLEYKMRQNRGKSCKEILDVYTELLEYLNTSSYGKISKVKIYPKTVVYMYKSLCSVLEDSSTYKNRQLYERLLKYSKNALEQLRERRFMFYMVELIETYIHILQQLHKYRKSASMLHECDTLLEKGNISLQELKKIYTDYQIIPYMKDDSYLYRQSGIYCTAHVILLRRHMYGISRNNICEGICSEVTLMRAENKHTVMQKAIVKEIFNRLNLMTDYISMFIVTDKKEEVELYEDIRYARNSKRYEEVEELLERLKKSLTNHPINRQILMRIEYTNKWYMKEITSKEYIEGMKKALEQTVDVDRLKELKGEYFLTLAEIEAVYSISTVYKRVNNYEEARKYIEILWDYCKILEDNNMADGEIGIYEMVMTYVASLLGDMAEYELSNHISDKLIKLSLKLRRGSFITANIYNIAWNHKEDNKDLLQFQRGVYRCICLSELLDDKNDELFYRGKL